MSTNMFEFYRAFEERHRGPRGLIKERLKVYLPFITPLLGWHHDANCLDLGCGRGEWLELMCEIGFESLGIDLDEGMLIACRERSLPILKGEAISTLKGIGDESYSVISGFHIVEHILFDALQELVAESLRVLRPGGLLILETPNPENIVVGTANFYLDPSHRQPIPPNLLAFLTEYQGFERTKILRLQESEDLLSKQDISLLDVLTGVSPDYAIVAQKQAERHLLALSDESFSRELGLDLDCLAGRFDKGLAATLASIEGLVARSAKAVDTAQIKAQEAEARAEHAELMSELARAHAQDAESSLLQLKALMTSIINSRSWRYTSPLRASATTVRRTKNVSKQSLKAAIRPSLGHVIRFINTKPWLKKPTLAVLKKNPALDQALYGFSRSNRAQAQHNLSTAASKEEEMSLSPRAIKIYQCLQTALQKDKEGGHLM